MRELAFREKPLHSFKKTNAEVTFMELAVTWHISQEPFIATAKIG